MKFINIHGTRFENPLTTEERARLKALNQVVNRNLSKEDLDEKVRLSFRVRKEDAPYVFKKGSETTTLMGYVLDGVFYPGYYPDEPDPNYDSLEIPSNINMGDDWTPYDQIDAIVKQDPYLWTVTGPILELRLRRKQTPLSIWGALVPVQDMLTPEERSRLNELLSIQHEKKTDALWVEQSALLLRVTQLDIDRGLVVIDFDKTSHTRRGFVVEDTFYVGHFPYDFDDGGHPAKGLCENLTPFDVVEATFDRSKITRITLIERRDPLKMLPAL